MADAETPPTPPVEETALSAAPSTEEGEAASEPATAVVAPEDMEPFSIEILPLILDHQRQHGLRRSDYNSYRQFCTRRIRRIRTSLGFLNGRHRFVQKAVTVDKVTDVRHLHIPLIEAERAWAYAMHDKQAAPEEPRKRHHAIRRLRKATTHAKAFAELVTECRRCDARTELEATAYVACAPWPLQLRPHYPAFRMCDDVCMHSYMPARPPVCTHAYITTHAHRHVLPSAHEAPSMLATLLYSRLFAFYQRSKPRYYFQ